jgi:hypothetical protein
MGEWAARAERLRRILMLRAEIRRLHAAARMPSMRAFIADADRDLTEAQLWLESAAMDQRGYILQLVDATIGFAQARLRAAETALTFEGPDSTLVG